MIRGAKGPSVELDESCFSAFTRVLYPRRLVDTVPCGGADIIKLDHWPWEFVLGWADSKVIEEDLHLTVNGRNLAGIRVWDDDQVPITAADNRN